MKSVQMVRMSAAQASVFVGLQGQLIVDTTSWIIRILDGITPGGFGVLSAEANLADLPNKALARSSLSLGSAALAATTDFDAAGTAASLVSAGLATALLKANNLSDVASAATARANLGLGTAALLGAYGPGSFAATVATSGTNVLAMWNADGDLVTSGITYTNVMLNSQNLSGLASAATARTNLGLGAAALKGVTGGDATVPTLHSFTAGNLCYFGNPGDGSIADSGILVTNVLTKTDNLGSLSSVPTARANLGLGNLSINNQTVSTSAASGTPSSNGDIWTQYTP